MKTNIKNFLRTIRRYKMAVALNVLGLSVSFAAFMIIMTQVHYDYSFDRFHKDYDKIFRLEITGSREGKEVASAFFARPFANQFIGSSPYILDGAITNFSKVPCRFHVETDGERTYYDEEQLVISPSFFDVFSFNFVEGTKNFAPRQVVIPLSLSRKIFGNESAVGQQIVHSSWGLQTVAAVYRDFPDNSSVGNYLYFALGETENIQDWSNLNYRIFIRVNDLSNLSVIIDNFKQNFEPPENRRGNYNWEEKELRLTALKNLHFVTDVQNDDVQKENTQTLMILFAISIVIIVIAGINFTNFSIALAPKRIKAINTQRIFGAGKLSMMTSIVLEAVFLSLLSCIIAVLLYKWFLGSPLVTFVDTITVSRPLIIGGVALMALLVGLLAGLYPARYMTSFAPALAIKGSFGITPGGKKLRNITTSVQFVASFVLIIAASFMYLQNRFMQKSPLGYNKDEIVTVNIGSLRNHSEAIIAQLKEFSGIEDLTYGSFLLANSDDIYIWNGDDSIKIRI